VSPLGGWEGQPIQGTSGVPLYDTRPRQEGNVPASLSPSSRHVEIRARLEREARVEAQMELLDPQSPRHKQMERVLVAARKRRKVLEREARKR
jgi:hypothetical protein